MRITGIAVPLLHCAAPSQTFVVDIANGPGTNYTSLNTAAGVVPDGAVLEVRPGNSPRCAPDALRELFALPARRAHRRRPA